MTSRLVLCVLVLASLPSLAQAPVDGVLRVRVTGVRSGDGQVGCSLFASDEGWPNDRDEAQAGQWAAISNGGARCTFRGVSAGTYAVGVIHDEDGDGELDTSIVGRPREGWGVSNDAPARRFGPPLFAPAAFAFDGTTQTITVRVHY